MLIYIYIYIYIHIYIYIYTYILYLVWLNKLYLFGMNANNNATIVEDSADII